MQLDRGMTWETGETQHAANRCVAMANCLHFGLSTALEELQATQAREETRREANGFYLPYRRGKVFLLLREPHADETQLIYRVI